MNVLIDTNVAINYISGREDPFSKESEEVMLLCADGTIEGFIALHSLSTIWYVTRKVPDKERRSWIKDLCTILTVSGASTEAILAAIDNNGFSDFEDALQDCCAVSAEADYIITINTKDYDGCSTIPAITPASFLELMK